MIKNFCFFVSVLFCWFISAGLQTVNKESNVKAAFVYNFTAYIDWDGYQNGNEFIIGVIGDSPITESLSQIANSKKVNGKKISIRKFKSPDEINHCHILFISSDTAFPLNEILGKAAVKGTLIISEKQGFASQGAAINFVVVNNNLKFEVNTKSITSSGLKASSQLLKLAILVE